MARIGWGSDPERNHDKFLLDEKISQEQGVKLLPVRSNFKTIIRQKAWKPFLKQEYLKPDVSMINSVLLLPFFISFILPVSEQLHIGSIVSGNEGVKTAEDFFCFLPAMTNHLKYMAEHVSYQSHLNELDKYDICRELYSTYPEIAKYQYSCWRNDGERWCHQCESCLRYYVLLKVNGIHVDAVQMDEVRIRKNMSRLIWHDHHQPGM